jgi:hypothetical protein
MTATCLCKYETGQDGRKKTKDKISTATVKLTETKTKRRWNDKLVNLVQGPASTKYFGWLYSVVHSNLGLTNPALLLLK